MYRGGEWMGLAFCQLFGVLDEFGCCASGLPQWNLVEVRDVKTRTDCAFANANHGFFVSYNWRLLVITLFMADIRRFRKQLHELYSIVWVYQESIMLGHD
jgi:hypothetical protein